MVDGCSAGRQQDSSLCEHGNPLVGDGGLPGETPPGRTYTASATRDGRLNTRHDATLPGRRTLCLWVWWFESAGATASPAPGVGAVARTFNSAYRYRSRPNAPPLPPSGMRVGNAVMMAAWTTLSACSDRTTSGPPTPLPPTTVAVAYCTSSSAPPQSGRRSRRAIPSPTLIERTLGTRGTGRNWNTVLKLGALLR